MRIAAPRSVFVFATALPFALAGRAAPGQTTRHVVSGDNVAIYNLIGSLRLQGGTGTSVVVEVTAGGADGGQLRVETGPIRGRETLRVRYPAGDLIAGREMAGDWGYGSTEVRVREDGTFGGEGGRRGEWDGDVVRIRSRGRGVEAFADLTVSLPAGKRIAIYLAVGKAVVSNVDGQILVDVQSAAITAERTRGSLTLDTGSGEIRLTDAQGDINLETGSGSVTVTNVRGTHLRIDTGSGSVDATDVEVGELSIDTGSGGVDVRRARSATINIDTGSGAVDVALLADVELLNIDTGSGGVTLAVPGDLGAMVDIDTGSGDIDLGFPVQVRRMQSDHVTGQIGDGRGRINIETGSGGVRLLRS
jgi:lia operon protein LiaG